MDKMWANSGDSHILEPDDIWYQILPFKLAERMPRSEKISDDEEIIHVDGRSFKRALPKMMTKKGANGLTLHEMMVRPPGARDPRRRLADLDGEGIWAEVIYASLGLWSGMVKDRTLVREAATAMNEWLVSEVQDIAPDRLVPAAQMPMLAVEDAVAEVEHAASIGLHIVNVYGGAAPEGLRDYNDNSWEPLWATLEETGLVLGIHVGDDPDNPNHYRGPGGAILNYVESTYSGQRMATKLVACGALDRHPGLKVLISEGGASWVPFIGDRMDEAYRQHGMFIRPQLSMLPKEILYRQVYASFQHDASAPAAAWAMGYPNVLWGSDYPHLEGTFGHTQKTLHELFDEVDPSVRQRITVGAFRELFPHTSEPSREEPVSDSSVA